MKFSIITPAYNSEKFICQLIGSFLLQGDNVELLIINDGSTDKTKEICNKYIQLYSNIKLINIENHGAGFARNIGIREATGEYIIFVDADDLLLPNSVNSDLYETIKVFKSDVIYMAKNKVDINLLNKVHHVNPELIIKNNMPMLEFWTCIYSRKFLLDNNIKFYEYKEQDIETAFRYKVFSNTSKVSIVSGKGFILQRDNPISNTHTFNYIKLYKIKSLVYYDLLCNSNIKEDFSYLYKVVIDNIYKLVRSLHISRNNSCISKEEYISIKSISNKIKPHYRNSSFKDILVTIYKRVYIYLIFNKAYNNSCNINSTQKSVSSNFILDDDIEILNRLKNLEIES